MNSKSVAANQMKSNKKTWPGVDPGSAEHAARMLASKQRERLRFSSEKISQADNVYVAWLDLMGSGNTMITSMHRTANAISRIHMAVQYACLDHIYMGRTLPINDGVFLISPSKIEIMTVIRAALTMLIGNFVANPNHPNRFLVRGAVAFGPVYHGSNLADQLELKRRTIEISTSLNSIAFGPPIIQAYEAEKLAPPYGIAVHESACAFAPPHEKPFRTRLWQWWQPNDDGKIPKPSPQTLEPLRSIFAKDLMEYINFLESTSSFQGLSIDKILKIRQISREYFFGFSEEKS